MKLLSCLALLLFAIHARAATLCATNASELQAALNTASNNQEDDVIRLETNTYNAPSGGFAFFSQDDYDITLSGGWTTFSGTPCGRRKTNNPVYTQLNGNGTSRVLDIFPNTHTNVQVELITFVDGDTSSLSQQFEGGGLRVVGAVDYQGNVTIERNIFKSNVSGDIAGGLYVYGGGELMLRNNLFIDNQASCTCGAAEFAFSDTAAAYAVNNTVAYNYASNSCSQPGSAQVGGLCMLGIGPALAVNNVLWGNQNIDLHVSEDNVLLTANDYGSVFGTPASGSGANYQLDPKFSIVPEYRLSNQSPLIDKGVVPGVADAWELSSFDLDGYARVVGNSVDLGAFENVDEIFFNGYE